MRKSISPGQLHFDFPAAEARARELEIEKRIAALPRELTRPEPFEGGSITSQPTPYRGTWFDSRTEAKWAVVWDLLAMEWRPDPIKIADYSGRGFIPDFYLPQLELYVEVASDDKHRQAVKTDRCKALADATGKAVFLTKGFPGPGADLPLLDGWGFYLPHPHTLGPDAVATHFPNLLRLKEMSLGAGVQQAFAAARKYRFEKA